MATNKKGGIVPPCYKSGVYYTTSLIFYCFRGHQLEPLAGPAKDLAQLEDAAEELFKLGVIGTYDVLIQLPEGFDGCDRFRVYAGIWRDGRLIGIRDHDKSYSFAGLAPLNTPNK